MLRKMYTDLLDANGLASQLAIRDIKVRYRQSMLGLIWGFIFPLANTAVWLFIQRSGIVTLKATTVPYPVYVITGTILWTIFLDAINAPLYHTSSAKGILGKINFPREALILSGIYQTFFNACFKITILLAGLLYLGVVPGWSLLFFPFAVTSLVLAGTAIGMLVTPIGVLYTDVGKGLPILLQFSMYLTPVVFPMPSTGWAATLFHLNPISPLILTARDLLTNSPIPYLTNFFLVTACMGALLLVSWIIYRASMPILIERIGN